MRGPSGSGRRASSICPEARRGLPSRLPGDDPFEGPVSVPTFLGLLGVYCELSVTLRDRGETSGPTLIKLSGKEKLKTLMFGRQ